MPKQLRSSVLALVTATALTLLHALVALASDGQVPFPR